MIILALPFSYLVSLTYTDKHSRVVQLESCVESVIVRMPCSTMALIREVMLVLLLADCVHPSGADGSPGTLHYNTFYPASFFVTN